MHRLSHAIRARQAAAGDFALQSTVSQYAPDLPLVPEHMVLRLEPDIDSASATVTITHTVRSAVDGARSLILDAVEFDNLAVDAADQSALGWHYDNDKITITWDDAVPAGETRAVRVSYTVDKPITGLLFGGPSPAEPQRGRFLATDHETERARYWLACVDHPSARTTLDIHLVVEDGLEAVATGALISDEADESGKRVVHWRSEARCPSYLLCIIVGEYVRYDDEPVDGKPLAYLGLPPVTPDDLYRAFKPTGDMIRYLNEKLGTPLPWAKYFQFAAPGIGGAMENISLVSWDETWIMDPLAHKERGDVLDLVNLHEMAHTWFGDLVVVRDFSHAWLKESWATYMESVWLGDTQSADEMQYQLLLERQAYRDEADNRYLRPIVTRRYDSSWRMFDRHLYPGGAIRLHLLCEMLGAEPFWAGVRSYIRQYAHKTAETEDFRRALEDASGRYLARFFDEWIYSPGYPKLKASQSHKDGVLTVSISQTQEDSKKGVGRFTFPLDVAVEVSEGEWARHTVEISETHHALRLSLDSKPLQIVIDPECKVPHALEFDPGAEMLKRTLTDAPWVVARISAAEVLGKSGRRSAIAAIEAAYRAESFWGVRVELARVLGAAKTNEAASAICALLPFEQDARVIGALTGAAGQYRDAGVAAALVAWLDGDGEKPYRAQASALTALGKQRGAEHLPRLQVALADRGWGAMVARGAAQGLAQTREPAALAPLLEALADPAAPLWLRRVIAANLPVLARELERGSQRQVREALEDQLRDPSYGMRISSVYALSSLRSPASAAAVEAARGALAAQDHPAITRALTSIRGGGDGSTVGKLRKQVESLTDDVRKLMARLAALEGKEDV